MICKLHYSQINIFYIEITLNGCPLMLGIKSDGQRGVFHCIYHMDSAINDIAVLTILNISQYIQYNTILHTIGK